MNAMNDDDTLDRQLRDAAPYIDDEGFTARVIARLPAPRREPRWLRTMVLLGVTALGSGVAYLLSGGVRFVLAGERIYIFKFFFRPEIADESHFEILAVDIAFEIEQVNLQNSLRFAGAHSRPITEVHYAGINNSIQLRFGEINAVWRKLLVVGAQICRRKSDFLSNIVAAHDCSQNRVFAAQHLCRLRQITRFHSLTDRRTAYHFAIDCYRRNSDDVEIRACAELLE